VSKILEYSQAEKMASIEAQVDDNIDIIIYLITEFNNTTDTYDFEDLLQVGFLGMLKAINKFDENKGELRDYIFCSVRNSLIKFLKKELQWKENVKLEPNISPDWNDNYETIEFDNILKAYSGKLIPLESKILELRFRGMTRRQICEETALTKNEYYTFLYSAIGKIKRYET
jgi:RNA polymerase sigma factor (sigma-70 family)